MAPSTYSSEMAKRRVRLGLNQTQAGALIGVDQARVSRIETGRATEQQTILLASALDALEKERYNKARAEAAAFWQAAWAAPNCELIVERIKQVVLELQRTSLRGEGFADRLLSCLPPDTPGTNSQDE